MALRVKEIERQRIAKETKAKKEQLARVDVALKELSKYKHIGVVFYTIINGEDFDLLFEKGWKLISVFHEQTYYFEKIKPSY